MIHIYLEHYAPCALNEKYTIEHLLGLKLLSEGLETLYGIRLSSEELPEHMTQNEFGKPYLKTYPQIIYNISHCDGLAACCFSDHQIGIDMERINKFNESIIRRLLTEEEKLFLAQYKDCPEKYNEFFYRFWTLKESRIKQAGMGFSMPLQSFSFTFDMNTYPLTIACSDKNLYFHQEFIENDCLLALCSDAPISDIQYHWK